MQYRGSSVRVLSGASTSTGQIRENNEDSIRLWAQNNAVLAIVADGMGGAAAGEEASRRAVAIVEGTLTRPEVPVLEALDSLADDTIAQKMHDTIRAANADIIAHAATNPDLHGMGTTVTLAFVRDMRAIVAHVGDSRAYLVSRQDRRITQITADHSFVEALVAAGHITEQEAEEHPMRSVLYRALGQADEIDVDLYYARLRPGDRLVLCSDGLTRHVKATEIADVALKNDDPERISQHLIDLANERGGEDNVSVIVVALEEGASGEVGEDPTREVSIASDDTLIMKPNEHDRLREQLKAAQTPTELNPDE